MTDHPPQHTEGAVEGPPRSEVTAQEALFDAYTHSLAAASYRKAIRFIIEQLAESGYVITKIPDGDEVVAVAEGLRTAGDVMEIPEAVSYFEHLARAAISTLTAYREGQNK